MENFKENFCKNSDDETSVDGVYRDLEEYLITLAKMYYTSTGQVSLSYYGLANQTVSKSQSVPMELHSAKMRKQLLGFYLS